MEWMKHEKYIALLKDLEERFPFRPHKIMTRLNADGSICDQ